MSAHATMLLIRPRGSTASLTRLQVLASDESGYRLLAVALTGFLLIPLTTLGSAAARLAVRSRDNRLAAIRLLGATSARVRRIAVAEGQCGPRIPRSESRELHVALDRIGIPAAELQRARRLRVTMPARVAVVGSALTVVVLAFCAVLMALLTAPLFLVGDHPRARGGLNVVRLGVTATAPVLRRVLSAPGRGQW